MTAGMHVFIPASGGPAERHRSAAQFVAHVRPCPDFALGLK